MSNTQRPPPTKDQPRPANKILAALPHEEFEQLQPKLREATFKLGEIIYRAEEPIDYVYFINRGIVSWLATLEDGNTVEAGVIGSEGLAGVSTLLGARSTPNQALTQAEVHGLRISSRDLADEFRKNGELNRMILRFVHSMFTQVAQTAACNRLHTLDQRLARWLLMTQDRAHNDTFRLTHDFLAYMLGVRRAGVTEAAGHLQAQRLIRYVRGELTVLNRRGLEALSCPCYSMFKATYLQHLGKPRSKQARGKRNKSVN